MSLELAKVVVCFRWGDWQGHVSTQPWTGLTFHDIRFKGDRIAYELSLNDQVSSRLLPLWLTVDGQIVPGVPCGSLGKQAIAVFHYIVEHCKFHTANLPPFAAKSKAPSQRQTYNAPLISHLKSCTFASSGHFSRLLSNDADRTASVLQIVAYSGYSTVGQTFYLDAFDQLGASQFSLL